MLAALSSPRRRRPRNFYAYSFDRLTTALDVILKRAVATDQMRGDITPEDLLRALLGLSYSYERPDWQATVTRLIGVFVDGLMVKR